MQTQTISTQLAGQVSSEQARQLDELVNEFQSIVTKVNEICNHVAPSAAASILYYFSGAAVAFARLANERSTTSLATLLPRAALPTVVPMNEPPPPPAN